MKKYNYRCETCGLMFTNRELTDDSLLCKECGGRLDEGSFTVNERPHEKNNQNYSNDKKEEFYKHNCLFCNSTIRIPVPLKECQFRCGKCKCLYKAVKLTTAEENYVIFPAELKNFSRAEEAQKKTQIIIPEHVKVALKVFKLSELVRKDELTKIYRKFISEYHPDKVAHLGDALKKLAEEKTREYISAYEVIKKFLDEQDAES